MYRMAGLFQPICVISCWIFMLLVGYCCADETSSALHSGNGTLSSESWVPLMEDIPKYSLKFTTSTSCKIRATDPYLHNKIVQMMEMKVKLINYRLYFANYTINPLLVNSTWSYQADKWARVSSQHGQTLLSLAFNYGILSMMTLTFGVESMQIELMDSPHGCMLDLSERDKIDTVMFLLMRDFKEDDGDEESMAETDATPGVKNNNNNDKVPSTFYNGNEVTLVDDERVCHEIIRNMSGYARFTDRCCHIDRITDKQTCTTDIENIWLSILYGLLACIKFSMLFFGPLMFIPMIETIAKENVPYVVRLKEALYKKILLVQADTPLTYNFKKVLDLRKVKGYPKFKKAAEELPLGEPIKIKISQYDILVGYKKLMIENKVPVGVLQCLSRTIFQCRLKDMGPFKDCCQTDVMRSCDSDYEVKWIDIWQKVARAMLVLLFPAPFYFRLFVFYFYEYPEVLERESAIYDLGLKKSYEGNLMHYLSPTHWLFITMYVLYFFTAGTLAFLARTNGRGKFNKIIVGSFHDLKHLSWINAMGMVVSNIIWPFRRFGLVGCAVALVYWPFAVPISIIICLFYCLPSIYITFRMLIHSRENLARSIFRKHDIASGSATTSFKSKYIVRKDIDKSVSIFETNKLFGDISPSHKLHGDGFRQHVPGAVKCQRVLQHMFVSTLCILTMFAVLVIMSECVGFIMELIVFTMMGVIVNAGSVLKYTTLIFLVLIYSYDTYNNVEKQYIKLNKSLFSEVKGRIKDIEEVTSLPSYLQENRGFKSQELSEQADYEQPDDVAEEESAPRNWLINDLVLFIDNEDMPRIPKDLFEEVCGIRVAGAPGPIYLSLLQATKSFLMILGFLFFVFLVVLSFGEVYQVSTTNQMLATLAGGFLPFILKNFMQPSKPDIELGTVSFKSKLDEIIKNFYQYWPIYDFPFTVASEEDEKEESDEEAEECSPCAQGICSCEACTCECKRIREMATQTNNNQDQLDVPTSNVQCPTPNPSWKSGEDEDLLSPLHSFNTKTHRSNTQPSEDLDQTSPLFYISSSMSSTPAASTITSEIPAKAAASTHVSVTTQSEPSTSMRAQSSAKSSPLPVLRSSKSTSSLHRPGMVISPLVPPEVSVTMAPIAQDYSVTKKSSTVTQTADQAVRARKASVFLETMNQSVKSKKASSIPETAPTQRLQGGSLKLHEARPMAGLDRSRRQTSPAIHANALHDTGIKTVMSIPLGTPTPGRRPTAPAITPNHHGITTIRSPSMPKTSTGPESVTQTDTESVPDLPPSHHGITTIKSLTKQRSPTLPDSVIQSDSGSTKSTTVGKKAPLAASHSLSRSKTSPSAVANIPMLDRNQNIHNFLNSASDFRALHETQGPDSFPPSRKDSVMSNLSVPGYHEVKDSSLATEEEECVDLLVFLPECPDNELWLKEWSDMDVYDKSEDFDAYSSNDEPV